MVRERRDGKRLVRSLFPSLKERYQATVGTAFRWRRTRAAERLDRYIEECGPRVIAGPFVGLTYPAWAGGWMADVGSKHTGSYEAGVHDLVECVIRGDPAVIVDIGCAEGYYAVGLARRLPGAKVLAIDISLKARVLCRVLAWRNRVTPSVTVRSRYAPGMAARYERSDRPMFFLFDCEGAEKELANPERFPELAKAILIVELHEFIHPNILEVLTTRFSETHKITLRAEAPFTPALEVLAGWTPDDQAAFLSERRPAPMRWVAFTPYS
jgi:hypothetical protein